ncbi:hypothetical protein GCM10007067_07030 [Lysobacter bugurensis]|uniref:CBM-cenC domain-containing protein n=1 Tax=Cognatilysobacter bugurensis TaxID=543356 RepID=A0A918W761_9GAMM|nr:hypothetical protein GCM10007067_07030 [Lysobacter bugurensis]
MRSGITPLRIALATLGTAAFAGAAWQVARHDTALGTPHGADRLIAQIDADPALAPDEPALAREMLRTRPIDGRAYRVLAQHADTPAQRDALLAAAVATAPRDALARGLAAERALLLEDFDAALEHVDALMRTAPESRTAVLATLLPHLAVPAIRDAFLKRLAFDPPWRDALARALPDAAVPADGALALLDAQAKQLTPSDAELRARIAVLERSGDYAAARAAWVAAQSTNPQGSTTTAHVYDGGFEAPHTEGGYGWRLNPPPGIGVAITAHDAHAGQGALAIRFDGRPVALGGIQQTLALPAGRYTFEAVSTNNVDTARPFEWQLACSAADGAAVAVMRAALPAQAEWQRSQATFDIAPACPQQTLRLVHRTRNIAERAVRGTLVVDGIRIIPMP